MRKRGGRTFGGNNEATAEGWWQGAWKELTGGGGGRIGRNRQMVGEKKAKREKRICCVERIQKRKERHYSGFGRILGTFPRFELGYFKSPSFS